MRQSHTTVVAAAIKSVITMIKSKPFLLLFVLFLLAFVIRAIFPDTSYFFWDETIYLLHGGLFSGHDVGYSELFQRPPLLPVLLSPFAGLAGYEGVSRLLVAFLNSLVVLPVYFLSKAVFGRKPALVAAAVSAALPVFVLNSRWVMTDALGAFLAFSSVAAYALGFRMQKRLLIYCGGLLAALAVLMKFTNLLLLVLLLPLLLVNLRRRFADIAASSAIFAAAIVQFLFSSIARFGSPFYVFKTAFHVVAESQPTSPAFFAYLLWDSIGLLASFLGIGVTLSIFLSLQSQRKNAGALFLLYCLLVTLAYSAFIINRGVTKPPGIEWEAERFLLLFMLFAVPFIGLGVVRFASFVRQLLPLKPAVVVIVAVAAVVLVSLYPQFARLYTPAIAYEDGLREVSKEMGLYLRSISVAEFGCVGNCPPVAYYSGRKMSVYYNFAEFLAANHEYVVVFDDNISKFPFSHVAVKRFCSSRHCAYLLVMS
ncbi:glycosyltransferase family 39 protein [Candidatus Woesearchaeota archaeon]|nr:glycosyltransferase family 39 protein [Candidatus Woesearchaeota archaeon]